METLFGPCNQFHHFNQNHVVSISVLRRLDGYVSKPRHPVVNTQIVLANTRIKAGCSSMFIPSKSGIIGFDFLKNLSPVGDILGLNYVLQGLANHGLHFPCQGHDSLQTCWPHEWSKDHAKLRHQSKSWTDPQVTIDDLGCPHFTRPPFENKKQLPPRSKISLGFGDPPKSCWVSKGFNITVHMYCHHLEGHLWGCKDLPKHMRSPSAIIPSIRLRKTYNVLFYFERSLTHYPAIMIHDYPIVFA